MKIDESWYVKPEGINDRLVAGGTVIRKDKDKVLILLMKTGQFEDYVLPKGGVEQGEDLKSAAKREIREETGITDLRVLEKIGITERLTFEKDYWSVCYYYLFITNQKEGVQELQDGEDYKIYWFDINKLPKFLWPEQEKLVKDNLEKIKKFIVQD